jgi:hypothetical protein
MELLQGIVFDPEVERRFRELLDGNDDESPPSTPTECGSDVGQDRFDHVRVVVNT